MNIDTRAPAIKGIKCTPNNQQVSIALSAIKLLRKYSRQLHLIGGGKGKSRIAATIAYLAITEGVDKVHLIFTSQILLKKDKEDFKDLWQIGGCEDKIIYHSNIDFEIGIGNNLMIFDEADIYMYE